MQLDAPATQLLAVGTHGEIKSTLNITAGGQGDEGTVVWQVEEVVRPYTQEVSHACFFVVIVVVVLVVVLVVMLWL